MPQPDPGGLFMTEGLSATWSMLINPRDGKPRLSYLEPTLTVIPFPLDDRICTNPEMNPDN